MPRELWDGKYVKLAYTLEPDGPHLTPLEDHYGNFASITCLLHGSGTCFIEGKTYVMSDGDIILVATNELRSFHYNHGGYHERVSLYLSSTLLAPLWEYELDLWKIFNGHPPGTANKYSLNDPDALNVRHIILQLCHLAAQCGETLTPKEDAQLHLLSVQLLFALNEFYERQGLPEPAYENDSVVWEICRYIHEHLSEDLSYESLQRALHVSRYYLSVLFRQNTGMTVTEFILQKRLIKVSELDSGGMCISKAAEASGFRNYPHFYKIFVKRKGVSPQKYYASENQPFSGGARKKES